MEINQLTSAVGLPGLNILRTATPDLEVTVSQMQCYNCNVFWTKMATVWVRSLWVNIILKLQFILVKKHENSVISLARFSAPCSEEESIPLGGLHKLDSNHVLQNQQLEPCRMYLLLNCLLDLCFLFAFLTFLLNTRMVSQCVVILSILEEI